MIHYDDLSHQDMVLLEAEHGSVSSGDVALLLYNCNLSYASNLLRKIWGKGLLKRKKQSKTKGGYQYRYSLNAKGERRTEELHEDGIEGI